MSLFDSDSSFGNPFFYFFFVFLEKHLDSSMDFFKLKLVRISVSRIVYERLLLYSLGINI